MGAAREIHVEMQYDSDGEEEVRVRVGVCSVRVCLVCVCVRTVCVLNICLAGCVWLVRVCASECVCSP